MKVPKHHYSKYLLSVHFERGFLPDTTIGMNEMCLNFLDDLGCLARQHGHNLHATYSIADGLTGTHAHFGVSWLPLHEHVYKTAKNQNKRIARTLVTDLFERNFFYVDNPNEAIKPITHDKRFVTNYITHQPKDGQSKIFADFYIHADFVPNASEVKMQFYCSKRQFALSKNQSKNQHYNRSSLLFLISVAWFILISAITLSLF